MSNVSTPDSAVPTDSDVTSGEALQGSTEPEHTTGSEPAVGDPTPGELDPRQPAAMALGLAASDQRRDVAVGLLLQLVAHDVGVLHDAVAVLREDGRAPDPATSERAVDLLEAAVQAADTTAGPSREIDLDALLDNAALFDSPSDYRAGVLDAVEALELREVTVQRSEAT